VNSTEIGITAFSQDLKLCFNLTDYSVRGQIRKNYADAEPTASFVCTITDTAEGKINILLGADETAAFTACKNEVDTTNYESADRNGQYVYDVEIYKGTPELVYRAIQGIIYVDAEVTKP
jgi:hypothetical protein